MSGEEEPEDQDRMRDLLASYYGMNSGKDNALAAAAPPPPDAGPTRSGNYSRPAPSGASSGSGGSGRGQPAPQWQIDSPSFDAPG
jgi:hypothetical protein